MRKKIIRISVVGALLFHLSAKAQNLYTLDHDQPEGANLGAMRGEGAGSIYSVDPYTGIGYVTIPIYAYTLDGMDLGVKLTYSTQGIQVNQIAGTVGLGWSLNHGPSLRRKTLGLEDEAAIKNELYPGTTCYQVALGAWYPTSADKNDVFTASLPGGNVSYTIGRRTGDIPKKHGSVSFDNIDYKEKRRIKITTKNSVNNLTTPWDSYTEHSNRLDFEIQDEQRNTFYFQRGDYQVKDFEHKCLQATHTIAYYPVENWTIKKVTSQTGLEVNYTYQYFDVLYPNFRNQIVREKSWNPKISVEKDEIVNWKGKKALISEIKYPNGTTVKFNYVTVPFSTTWCFMPVLGSIEVTSELAPAHKNTIKYVLNHAYFVASSNTEKPFPPVYISDFQACLAQNYSERLKLTSIDKIGADNITSEKLFDFDYITTQNLPTRLDVAQDAYGYFNGKTATSLIRNSVNHILGIPLHTYDNTTYGIDRNSDWNFAKANNLKMVTLGSGATVQFDYGGHTLSNVDTVNSNGTITTRHLDTMLKALNACDGVKVVSITEGNGFGNYIHTSYSYSGGARFWKGGYFFHCYDGNNKGSTCVNYMLNDYDDYLGTVHGYTNTVVEKTNQQSTELLSKEEFTFANTTRDASFFYTPPALFSFTATQTPIRMPNDQTCAPLGMDRIIGDPFVGKLLEKKTFGTNNNLLQRERNYYEQTYFTYGSPTHTEMSYRLSHRLEETHQGGKTMSTLYAHQYKDMEYDLLESIQWSDSRGETRKTIFDYDWGTRRCFLELDAVERTGDLYVTGLKLAGDHNLNTGLPQPNFYTQISNEKFQTPYKVNGGNLVPPGSMLRSKRYTFWDPWNNILETQLAETDRWAAYIWDTRIGKRIAEATNAKYSQIAYSGFEGSFAPLASPDFNKGNWVFDPAAVALVSSIPMLTPLAGKYCYDLSASAQISSKNSLESGKDYIVTLWSRSTGPTITGANLQGTSTDIQLSNGWKVFTYRLRGLGTPITLSAGSGSIKIDELRLHPYDADMVTYTYEPLFGPSAINPADNNITYIEYDAFGRQKLVRDRDGNILSQTQTVVNGPDN